MVMAIKKKEEELELASENRKNSQYSMLILHVLGNRKCLFEEAMSRCV